MGMTIEEKKNLIDMFREQIFPSQARTLLKQNFEGKGELDKQEYLRDTNRILDLAEKGLQVELMQSDYEAQTRWIPVSERLPDPRAYVDGVERYYLIQNEYGDMMVANWDGFGWGQIYRYCRYIEDKVVAWMPLPKPYDPQKSEE